MDRLESAAWPLAGGVLCAFVVAVAFKDVAWPVGLVLAGASVACWSLTAPPVVGVSLGLTAWTFVTGFDVVGSGVLAVGGPWDAARAVVLVGTGAAASALGAGTRRAAPAPAETGWPPPPEERAGDADRPRVSRPV